MGQYYRPCVIEENKRGEIIIIASLYSHDYDNGLKLMEHSYVGNNFVNAFSQLIGDEGGEYAGEKVVWAGDYADKVNEIYNLYNMAKSVNSSDEVGEVIKPYKYIINLSKKEYVTIPEETDDLVVHPLPLLTAMGNGRGGGDYYENYTDYELVGSWAMDNIKLSNKLPPKDYTEIFPKFAERV